MKLVGIVRKHLGRGKKLGYPTANIDIPLDVEEGIFLGYVHFHSVSNESEGWPSLVFIGRPKTFLDDKKRLEAYILDFNKDLYGQKITVELIKKIRDNIKFENSDQLVQQMKKDEAVAREYFSHYNSSN